MLTFVYRIICTILHLLVSVYETLRWLSLRFQAATLWSYDHLWRSQKLHSDYENNFLRHCKERLTKVPQHLNIIVGIDDTQVDSELLASIFKYALIMNINCVSVYDARQTKDKSHTLLQHINPPTGMISKELHEHHYLWSSSPITNGHTKPTENSIEIYDLTPVDGRVMIADVCRTLFQQRHSIEMKELLRDRTKLTQRINDELTQRLHKMPDPELAIIFSRQMCTYGLLPWNTRFTEFHLFESGCYFNAQAFAMVLCKYSRCEQRWGK